MPKIEGKTNFRGAYRLPGTGIVKCLEIIEVIWNSLVAWPDWPWLLYFTTDLRHCFTVQSKAVNIVSLKSTVSAYFGCDREIIHFCLCEHILQYLVLDATTAGGIDIGFVTGRLHGTIVGPTGRSDWSVRLVGWSVYTFRSSDRLVGPTQATSDWSVRPVGPTGRTDCSRTAHICQSNQCGLLAD